MDDRFRVQDVTVERERSVTIVFGDGYTATYDLVEMRTNCPCAGCRGDRDRGVEPWPKPSSPLPLSVKGAELAGAWGLSIEWNDGHAAGIYPWDSLRHWAEDGEPRFTPDSGRGT